MEGKTTEEIFQLERDLGLKERDLVGFRKIEAAGGEGRQKLRVRLKSIFEEKILKDSEEDKKFLMICHGGTVLQTQHFLLDLQNSDAEGWSQEIPVRRVPNASLT